MTEVTAQARHRQSREAALEEMSLQTSVKSRQRGCRRYVLRQTVPHVWYDRDYVESAVKLQSVYQPTNLSDIRRL